MNYEKIKVALRCRPLRDEESRQYASCVSFQANSAVVQCISQDGANQTQRSCSVDRCYDATCINEQLFSDMLRPMVERCVLKGVSGTVVVLGSQGAGKIHTLLGDGVQSGLIKRACEELFERTRAASASHRQFAVRLSALDIRAESVVDLLSPSTQQSLPVSDSSISVPSAVQIEAQSADEALVLVQQALRVRTALQRRAVVSPSQCIIDLLVDSRPWPSSDAKATQAESAYNGFLRFVLLPALSSHTLQTDKSLSTLVSLLGAVGIASQAEASDAKANPSGGSATAQSALATAQAAASALQPSAIQAAQSSLSTQRSSALVQSSIAAAELLFGQAVLPKLLRSGLGCTQGGVMTVIGCLSPVPSVADSDANQCVLDMVEKFGAVFNAARPSIDASDAHVTVLRESIRAARDRVEQAAAHDDVSIDPQWAATMRRQLDELNSIKRNTWDGRHAASLQAIETRKSALDREGLMWVVDESAALQANSVAIMEKERWRCVQLLKKKREAQRRVESARIEYAEAYAQAAADPATAQSTYEALTAANDDLNACLEKVEKQRKVFDGSVRTLVEQESAFRRTCGASQHLNAEQAAWLQRSKDELDWNELDSLMESDDKFVGKQAEIEAGMQDSLQSIQASYADDRAMVPAAQVRDMAVNFATEKARLNSNELELKWERDFVIGKLLEREARHAAQIAKMQEHMLLMFRDYRRQIDDRRAKAEAACTALVDEAVAETMSALQAQRAAEERVKRLQQSS